MDLTPLVKLQDVDKKMMILESSTGDLPTQVDGLKRRVENLEKELSKNLEELTKCTQEKKKIEGNIDFLNGKLKKYQEQVYSVTTNKEYDAISLEIELKQKEIEESETTVLECFEKEDNINKQINNINEHLEQIRIELDEKERMLSEKLKENEQELAKLLEDRKSIVAQIEKPIYANYERIRKARKGIAISRIKNYTCEECFATIPAQTVVEARKMNSIILCETCGRILVSTNSVE